MISLSKISYLPFTCQKFLHVYKKVETLVMYYNSLFFSHLLLISNFTWLQLILNIMWLCLRSLPSTPVCISLITDPGPLIDTIVESQISIFLSLLCLVLPTQSLNAHALCIFLFTKMFYLPFFLQTRSCWYSLTDSFWSNSCFFILKQPFTWLVF